MKNLFKGFNMALGMFSVIPPFKKEWDEECGHHMIKMFPIVGLIIGILWFGITVLLIRFRIHGLLLSGIVLAIPFLLTGFLHLDGFMDVCDAILSRREKEVKLRILKDSTIGAFSVIALVLLLIIQFGAIENLLFSYRKIEFLALIPFISRTLVAIFLLKEEPIEESYFAKLYKKNSSIKDFLILVGLYLIGVILFLWLDLRFVIIPFTMAIGSFICLWKCKKEFGGINGDVAGYILVFSEFIGLLTLAII